MEIENELSGMNCRNPTESYYGIESSVGFRFRPLDGATVQAGRPQSTSTKQ